MLATSNELLRGWRWRSQGLDEKGKPTSIPPSLLRVGGDDSSRSMCISALLQLDNYLQWHICTPGDCAKGAHGLYVSAGRQCAPGTTLIAKCQVARLRGVRSAARAYCFYVVCFGCQVVVVLASETSKQHFALTVSVIALHDFNL